ncbi:DNA polymerase IV [Saccharopolyspora phatthalungensis]|uniref:DNA polymerase IV n=1 Tax=Saccharopolyspora phatthalungensis TaxID=664693 RepID=A0A840Q5X1_9PSEU|nr:DNA polymerase IV [Saccharopolyspora phatthalungensis]MBB5155347.1 DNA polymerase-4 [Saccharopolyspora phatthalungensis]
MRRWVLHMDMDAFFASVEQLTRPTVQGRPVLVGGLGPRGTVAGASYEAREFGARSAMPMAEARRRCPVAVVLPPRFRVYQAVSKRVLGIVREVSDVVEQVSVDEAFLEPTELAGATTAQVEKFATQLRARVRREVGVTASIGAGAGKQLAKIASGLAKPDGMLVVPPDQQLELLSGLPVRKMWGVGPVTESKLHRIGVQTIGELAALHLNDVTSLLGQAHGTELHRLAHGIDDHPVAERAEAKQVSAETTFDTDITDQVKLLSEVTGMAESGHRRLVSSGRAARTVTIKVRDSGFTTISRAETFASATSDLAALSAAARRLLPIAVPPGTPVRLVGVSYSGLATSEQEPLFDNPADQPEAAAATAQSAAQPSQEPPARHWRAGDDVRHAEFGHGWVQGAGHGRVTVRFETAISGRGVARTFALEDPLLSSADPVDSLGW